MKSNWINGRISRAVWLALVFAALIALPARASSMDAGTAMSVQERLVQLGFLESAPDGIYGAQTEKALERLAAYMAFTGNALEGERLIGALIAGEVPPSVAAVGPGDVSETVMRVQRRLRVLSYLSDKADGQYGDNTERAVALFQRAAGISVTGAADEGTQSRLFADNAPAAAYPVLSKGMKGERVREMQLRLAELGFFIGRCDGHYGADTVLGVKALQTYVQTSGHYASLDVYLRDAKIDGLADPLVQELLYADDVPAPAPMANGSSGQEVYRVQRRLIALTYLGGNPDGGYGDATAAAVKAFQARNGLKATGDANDKTIAALFSPNALEPVKPYKLVVSIAEQALYVYKLSDAGAYDHLTYTMRCSTGPSVAPGEYAALTGPASAEWQEIGGQWVRYPYALTGTLLIHSIPHSAKQGEPVLSWMNELGKPTEAMGGVMLSVEDARLIYEKCPRHTPVEVTG